jgi:hypothetical protein
MVYYAQMPPKAAPVKVPASFKKANLEIPVLSGQVKTGHTWSLQNRPYGPGLRCCTLPFAFLTSLISEISKWRAISSSKLEKISFTGPWGHFLKVSHSSGCGFLATFRRGAHCSAGNLVLQLRGPHLRIWPWWRRRSSIAVTAALSPSSFPQSSTGLFDVTNVLVRS